VNYKINEKRLKVNKEVKGQTKRAFTKITTNSFLDLMQRIKTK
jgi:hypothetical protein